jgi:hypothetical protein
VTRDAYGVSWVSASRTLLNDEASDRRRWKATEMACRVSLRTEFTTTMPQDPVIDGVAIRTVLRCAFCLCHEHIQHLIVDEGSLRRQIEILSLRGALDVFEIFMATIPD